MMATEYNAKITDYEILIKRPVSGEGVNIQIYYNCDGKVFTSSQVYQNVAKEKIIDLTNQLDDYTSHNKNQKGMSGTIPLLTIIHFVEEIIYNR